MQRREGPPRTGDIAEELRRSATSLGPVRGSLITKGMIGSPTHGNTAFSVSLFDEFMRRIMSTGSNVKTSDCMKTAIEQKGRHAEPPPRVVPRPLLPESYFRFASFPVAI